MQRPKGKLQSVCVRQWAATLALLGGFCCARAEAQTQSPATEPSESPGAGVGGDTPAPATGPEETPAPVPPNEDDGPQPVPAAPEDATEGDGPVAPADAAEAEEPAASPEPSAAAAPEGKPEGKVDPADAAAAAQAPEPQGEVAGKAEPDASAASPGTAVDEPAAQAPAQSVSEPDAPPGAIGGAEAGAGPAAAEEVAAGTDGSAGTASISAAGSVAVEGAAAPGTDAEVEEIVVTGTRIRRSGTFPSSTPVQVIDSAQLVQSGAKNLGDVIQNLTAAPGSGVQGMGAGSSAGRVGTSAANLRGLGFGATLVLLNGRRVVKSAAGASGGDFSDLSIVPLGAVRRVEVLKGGASAVYGADAVAGVINIITYKDWSGLRVFANADAADDLDYKGYQVGFTFGSYGERGGVMLSADWDLHTELLMNQRDWTRKGAHVVPQSFPGTFLVGATPTPDPDCDAGRYSSEIERMGMNGTSRLCAFSDRDHLPLFPAIQRGNVFGSAEYKLTEHTEAFAETLFSRMDGDAVAWPFMVMPAFSLTVPADHVDNIYGQPVRYSGRIAEQAHGRNTYGYNTFRIVAGLRGDFEQVAEHTLFEDWEWELFTTYGISQIQSNIPENLRPALQNALNSCSDPTDLSGCFNPFYSSVLGTGTPNSAAVLAEIQTEHATTRISGMRTQNASVSGTLFDLPGGPLGLALGGQVRQEWAAANSTHEAETNRLGLIIGATDYKVSRNVYAGFLELRVPVVSGLELQAAGRVERHSDINQTSVNPTLGFTASPAGFGATSSLLRRLTLRGHVARAFRAPSMTQSSDVQLILPTQIDVQGGAPLWLPVEVSGNPDVKSETALAWSAGLEWSPIDELSLLAEYWSFNYRNRIESEDPVGKVQQWQQDNRAAGGCDTSNPAIVVDPSAGCTPTQVRVQTFNADGTVATSGLDFGIVLRLNGENFGGSEKDWGTVSLGAEGVYTFSYTIPRSSVVDAVVDEDVVDCDGNGDSASCEVVGNRNATNFAPPLPRLRVNFPLRWSFAGHGASFIVRHIGGVHDDRDTSAKVASMTTLDLQYAYTIEDWVGHSLSLRVGALNLLDQDPPLVASEQLAFDPEIHDPRGRMVYAKMVSEF